MVSRELVEQLIQNKTQPLAEQLVEMADEIEELNRRLNQMIRFGTVIEINSDETLIKVQHGKNETKFIKWFTLASGEMNQYRCPSKGELALLLDISSGVSSNYLALCGWEGEKFPFPIKNAKQAITQFGPLEFLWDSEAETITIKAPKKIILDTELVESTGDVADQVRTMSEDRELYNAHDNHPGNTPPNMPQ
ncbi:phage baseplate assembly protein V [Vibrio europaeus]|uniref:phage baseplate assembly protein V n=1 Tax=Vibrio europaeus TaxID=300876 RepID=UPI00233E57D9|nr:phage baseplate assembly protein V [Vibrio europaeus]MDC5718264.1 phage baseplate assembly protein V [Vibrio europaeus]